MAKAWNLEDFIEKNDSFTYHTIIPANIQDFLMQIYKLIMLSCYITFTALQDFYCFLCFQNIH